MTVTGVVILNPSSGPDDHTAGELQPFFPGAQVVETDGKDLEDLVRRAVSDDAGHVAIAGGDGTIRSAAAILAEAGVALLPVPTGTRNHFAREVGIDTLERAGEAWSAGVDRRVDLAEVNGERFVNNSSIGFYAALVKERESHERHLPKYLAQLVAAWAQARKGHRFRVTVAGTSYLAWIVFVGNGCYGDKLTDLAGRETLDANVLDVRILRADERFARIRSVVAIMLGRDGRSSVVERLKVPEVEISLAERTSVDVALDGEVVRLANPLSYRSMPCALTVRVPAGDGSAA